MDSLNVLISLHKGYGLGDGCQMSAVLRHVRKYRPHWVIDYQAEDGKHCVGRGLVNRAFAYGANPNPNRVYGAEVLICLYDTWPNFRDRPNTRVSTCLRDHFDIEWDAECGRYYVEVSQRAADAAKVLVMPSNKWHQDRKEQVVAVHYQGDSSKSKKDLTHAQAAQICKEVGKLDCTPLLLDWRDVSPIVDVNEVRTVGRIPQSKVWGADAEMNCAVIGRCAAFVGIDSGPSKCASATDTPALVVWTGHHPAPFHDPAPNTTHLVPRGYHGLEPVCGDPGVIAWFEAHHKVRMYDGDPVREITAWLEEVLGEKLSLNPTLADQRESKARAGHRRHDG